MRTLILSLLLCCSFSLAAQTTDVMIVEYLDQPTGSGWGITVYNPTNQPINLTTGNYILKVQANGNQIVDSVRLTGILAPGATRKIGNTTYCNVDCNNCDFTTLTTNGVNGDDFLALFKGTPRTFVDMIGRWGATISGYRVDGVSNGLFTNRLVRDAANCNRYTNTSGSGTNSWPSSSTTNVTGWRVTSLSNNACLNQTNFNFVFAPGSLSAGNDVFVCDSTRYTLRANQTATGGSTLVWSNGTNGQSTVVRTSGKYWVTLSNGICSLTDTVNVTFGQRVSAGLGPDVTICEGSAITLRTNVPGNPVWSNGATTDSIRVTTPGTYSVRVRRNAGCDAVDTVIVTRERIQYNFLGSKRTACSGDTITLTAPVGSLVRWPNGQVSNAYRVTTNGNVIGQLVGTFACTNLDTVTVEFKPVLADTIQSVFKFCTLDGAIIGAPLADAYLWSTGATTQTITPQRFGSYAVTITKNGCSKSLSTAVVEDNCAWIIPNVITPNKDGLNDFFSPSASVFKSADFKVFNRYGVQIASSNNPDINWIPDETLRGTYYFHLKAELKNGTPYERKGWLFIAR